MCIISLDDYDFGLSSVHTRADYTAQNGRLFTETNFFYFSNGQLYGVLRHVIRSV